MSLDTSFAVFMWKYWLCCCANYQVGFITTRSHLASLLFEVLTTKCTAVKWFILSIMNNYHYLVEGSGGMGKWDFWRQRQRILSVLFLNRLYPIQCSLLDGCIGLPASCHLTTRLSAAHSQPYNSGESIWCFYLLVPPFSPTGYKSMPEERLPIYCGDIIRTK